MKIRRALPAALALLAAAAFLACGDEELVARWTPSPIKVDGALDEWTGAMTTVRGADARIGVRNDGDALYIALGTDDPGLVRLVARSGLTLWLDPRGGSEKALGVVFPQPAYADGPAGSAPDMGHPGGARVDTVELLGPAPYTRKEIAAPGENGVEVAVGNGASAPGSAVLTYELRVPLAATPWGAGVRPGATIGIGILTNRVAPWTGGRPRGEESEGHGPGGRGGYGRMNHAGGGFRGAPGEWRGMQVWARVRLARPPR